MARISLALLAVPWLLLMSLVSGDAVKDLQDKGRPAVDAQIAKSKTCTKQTLQVRREWWVGSSSCRRMIGAVNAVAKLSDRGDITAAEKKAYIAAMLCLMGKPSKLDNTRFPGAKSRYDDFVVVHINQTLSIHGTVRWAPPSLVRWN